MRKNFSTHTGLGTFQVLIILTLGVFSCGKTEEEITYPEKKSLTESVYASGLVKAKDQYEAFTSASGPIQEILVEEGDTVSIGTPILQVFSEREKLGR